MATLSELRSAIRLRVGDDNSARWQNAGIDEIINQAVRELSAQLRNYIKTATVLFEPDTLEVDVADLLEVVKFVRDDQYPLWEIPFDSIKGYRESESSQPILWYRLGDTIGVYPAVEANTNLTLTYVAYAPSLSGDSDTTHASLGPMGDNFIIARAASELLMADTDYQGASQFQIRADKYMIDAMANRNQYTTEPNRVQHVIGGTAWQYSI